MSCGSVRKIAVVVLSWLMLAQAVHSAPQLNIVTRFSPEDGDIADAALMPNNHIALLYPDNGRIADYSMNGMLSQHIIREGGVESRFKPVACMSGPQNMLYVFDEATSSVHLIGEDGNIYKGINQTYPLESGGSTVLSRIGDLWVSPAGSMWALLPDRGVLAEFDTAGEIRSMINLRELTGEPLGAFSRVQFTSDGSLYALDYHQGAVFRIRPSGGGINRVVAEVEGEADALPMVQDFAVDPRGNILMATYDSEKPLILLEPEDGRLIRHRISLGLPPDTGRLACRFSGGKFIVWSRESPFLIVLQLEY